MTRQDLQRQRQAKHRLAVIRHAREVSGNVSANCRYYGISRNCYYKWLRRYEEECLDGLQDRSSAPHHMPTATTAEVVEKIFVAAPAIPLRPREDRDVACSATTR